VPGEYLGATYEGLDGVEAAMPITAGFVTIPTSSGSARTIQLDSTRAAEIVAYRDDFADDSMDTLMAPLIAGRPELAGFPGPGEPLRIALDVQSSITRICTEPELERDEVGTSGVHTYETYSCLEHEVLRPWELRRFDVPLTPAIVIQDSRGQLYRVEAPPLESSPVHRVRTAHGSRACTTDQEW
jgi:hypothetical protein